MKVGKTNHQFISHYRLNFYSPNSKPNKMIFTTTNYGKFYITGYTETLTVQILRKGDETPKELVRKAIMFANEFKCRICRRVEYVDNEGVTFEVKCDSKTNRFIYMYGSMNYGRASCTPKSLRAYQREFSTDRCIHRGFVKKYWFTEDFHGDRLSFNTLDEAIEEAASAYGYTVYIYTNVEFGGTELVCKAKASGTILP